MSVALSNLLLLVLTDVLGSCIASVARAAFDRIFSMFASVEKDVAFSNSSLTHFVGFMYRKSAPQKVSPRPMKAKIQEEERKDDNRAIFFQTSGV